MSRNLYPRHGNEDSRTGGIVKKATDNKKNNSRVTRESERVMKLASDCVVAPREAVEILDKPLGELMPWHLQSRRALERIASRVDGVWVLKVGRSVAQRMSQENSL